MKRLGHRGKVADRKASKNQEKTLTSSSLYLYGT